ncbi:MAG TPA: 50S ribosomal protein L15 [Polyangiales bacterium]
MAESDKNARNKSVEQPAALSPILSNLRAPAGAVKNKHRVGRGPGSGWGTTAGRGSKGQFARNTVRPGFEGGQTPLFRRLPKIGFKNPFTINVATVNVEQLKRFDKDSVVDIEAVLKARLVSGRFDSLKILGNGELDRALTVKAHAFSARAKEQIEKAGGKVELIPAPKPVDTRARAASKA